MNELITTQEKEKLIYNYYIKEIRSIEKIEIFAEKLDIKLDDFFKYLIHYIDNNISKPDYAKILDKLLTLATKNKVIEYLDSIPCNLKYLKDNVLAYFYYYRPDIYFLNPVLRESLRQKLAAYDKYLKDKDMPKVLSNDKNSLDYATKIIKSFISSQYTIKRFCFNKNIQLTEFNKYLNLIKRNNQVLYNEYLLNNTIKEEIKARDIKNNVYNVLNKIKELGCEFNLIDLLSMTVYSIKELIEEADAILDIEDKKLFRKHLNRFNNIKPFTAYSIQNLFNNVFIININGEQIEITEEVKEIIINYLKEKDFPICNETYHVAIVRYYQDRLYDISPKHKVLK